MNITSELNQIITDKNVLNVYLMGSRLWGTATENSDYDLIVVVRDLDSFEGLKSAKSTHGNLVDTTIITTKLYQERINNHDFLETVTLFLPKEYVLKEIFKPKRPKFNHKKWQDTIEYRISRDVAYANKNTVKGKIKRASKTRYMCLNTIMIADQIYNHVKTGSEIDFTIAKKLRKPIITSFSFQQQMEGM